MTTRLERLRDDVDEAETHEDRACAYESLSDALDSRVIKLEAVVRACQDWLCSGNFVDGDEHAARMNRINALLGEGRS